MEEASNAKTYVSGHLYTDEGIERAIQCGVHSVEHANLIRPATAKLMKERGAIACPTLVLFKKFRTEGLNIGLSKAALEVNERVWQGGLESLGILKEAGVLMTYGTDLLGHLHEHQSEEFLIRREALSALEVIRSATVNAATLLRMQGKVGTVNVGAFADLIALDGDPIGDISILAKQGAHMPLIVKAGRPVKNLLS